jgi:predicted nucleotide-binding protein
MSNTIVDRLSKLVAEGEDLTDPRGFDLWFRKIYEFIRVALGQMEADDFARLSSKLTWEQHAMRMGHLHGLIAKMEAQELQLLSAAPKTTKAATILERQGLVPDSKKVFLVHGHDSEAKEGTARFLEKVGLQPVILHEQPNSGRTIIEKFEVYSGDIAFAVVLLTPDDFGGAASSPGASKPRARQNVIMELGYFIGRLGRFRVCALHKGGVELP